MSSNANQQLNMEMLRDPLEALANDYLRTHHYAASEVLLVDGRSTTEWKHIITKIVIDRDNLMIKEKREFAKAGTGSVAACLKINKELRGGTFKNLNVPGAMGILHAGMNKAKENDICTGGWRAAYILKKQSKK